MDTRSHSSRLFRPAVLVAGLSTLALTLSAYAGSAGEASENEHAGFEFGASQEVVDEALADLDPITITYQPAATSPNSSLAPFATEFEKIVEERSGGKIEVDIVYGQAIAGYNEVHDALADGRLDMAYTLPIYQPDEFPAFNDVASLMANLPSSPFQQELVTYVSGTELGWNSEAVLQDYEDKGLTPLTPLAARGIFYPVCNDPSTSAEDWNGLQTRIGSSAQGDQVDALGGSPVSIEYAETYEALERGTVDCTMFQLVAAVEGGFLEVAPHINHTTANSFASAPGAVLAGANFQNLPLPYQQLIFDANLMSSLGGMESIMQGKVEAIRQAKDAGGEISALSDEVLERLEDSSEDLKQETLEAGNVDESIIEIIDENQTKWSQEFESLGYVDEGPLEELDEWFDTTTDFDPYVDVAIEQGSALDKRP